MKIGDIVTHVNDTTYTGTITRLLNGKWVELDGKMTGFSIEFWKPVK